MTRRDFIWLLGLIGCSKYQIEPVKSTKLIHTFFSGTPFNPDQYMDLINLKSINQSQFTLTGSSIDSWNDGISAWTNTGAARPTLTGGVPLFDGGDQLIRAAELSLTTYSLYLLFKNTGTSAKVMLGAQSDSTYFIHQANYEIQHAIGGVGKLILRSGINYGASNNRYNILSVRRSDNTFTVGINDRTAYVTTNNFAGEATKIARLMAISGGFIMTGGVRSVCMSSQSLSDSVHTQVLNKLYSDYSLSSDNSTMTVFGIGDSNTSGQGATSYLVALASGMGLAYCNLGISGTLFTSGTNSGVSRYASQLNSRPYTDKVVIQYGTNDVSAAVASSTYLAAFDSMISAMIAAGWQASKICICSIPYQASGLNATLLQEYATGLSNIASTYGTKYFDLYTDIKDNGGNANLSDTVHLNATGQTRWQNGVAATGL